MVAGQASTRSRGSDAIASKARSRASLIPGLSTVAPSGNVTTGTTGLPGPPLP